MNVVAAQPARTNRLIDATSPYLLQHAHNPVDWYPWGEEALARAKAEAKPIFLSIGYSSCHWCHVMERESFENEEIAAVINRHFIPIKVDREERPDLDEIYMNATLIYNRGQGGWPMSVFLTPERKPFFAGTYFPPTSRYGRPGFEDLLLQIARLWKDDRQRLLDSADALTDALRRYGTIGAGANVPPPDTVSRAAETYRRIFDHEKGGVLSGSTNKFPPSMAMQVMLRQYRRSLTTANPQKELLELVELTLSRMAHGGIYDQLGGGICRYSTDPDWLVPHFEKMLYDQALVSDAYLDAWLLTKTSLYAETARSIFDYVLEDLQSPEGGFYSARDADSEGEEGKYYVWTLEEIRRVLGERDAALFAACYDVSEAGNWHPEDGHAPPGPRNILNVPRGLDVVARGHGIPEPDLRTSLDSSRKKLLDVRRRRVPPALDDKVLTAWNGLMIASLAKGSRVLDEPRYRNAAVRAADLILARLTKDGRLLRTYRDGRARIGAYLDDYAYFIEATLNLYEATLDRRWLDQAARLTDQTIEHFYDKTDGAFFFTADDAEQNIIRGKDAGDAAVPSGNSVHAMNLLRLAVIFDRADWRAAAESVFRTFGARLEESPLGFDRLLAALDFHYGPTTEIAIIGRPSDAATEALLRTIWDRYLPNKVIVSLDPADARANTWAERIPLVANRHLVEGKPTAFVCENYTCRRPVNDPQALVEQLG
jgi:uncharacterized protein YyaL (SSP411 family)